MQKYRADAHIVQVELSGELGQQPRAVGHDGGMRLELERQSVRKRSADSSGGCDVMIKEYLSRLVLGANPLVNVQECPFLAVRRSSVAHRDPECVELQPSCVEPGCERTRNG